MKIPKDKRRAEGFGIEWGIKDMEWLALIVIAVFAGILWLYYIVKWTVKDALREYFRDKDA